MTRLVAGAATDVGLVRTNNEDQLLVTEHLFAVADGMGGHAAGEVASLTAVEALRAAFVDDRSPDGLAEAVRTANRAVWDRANEGSDTRGMGTTVTAVALVEADGEEQLSLANVGDSRAYLFRDGELTQLTDDHSLPEEMVRRGELSREEAATHPQRHILTRVLGMDSDVEVDSFQVVPYRGDRLLLATDGLFNEVDDSQIAAVLRRIADPDEVAKELVRLAKEGGGADNITIVVVDVVDDDDRAARASAALAGEASSEPATEVHRPLSAGSDDEVSATSASGRGQEPTPEDDGRGRRLTGRAVAFTVAVVLVVIAAFAAIAWYARASYYVGLTEGDVLAVYKGRPGGLLWFDPTLEYEVEDITEDEVPAAFLDDVRAGHVVASRERAARYVQNLRTASQRQQPPPTPPASPAPPAPTVAPAPTTAP